MESNVVIAFMHPSVESSESPHCRRNIDWNSQLSHPTEASHDVEGQILVVWTTGEPRPHAIVPLHLRQFTHRAIDFRFQPIFVKQNADVATRLRFSIRVSQPWRLLDHHRFDVLVFRQWRNEGFRLNIPPGIKHATDFGIAVGNVLSQVIGIQPIEGLLAAFIWKLHQVRQCEYRIPGRLRNHLHRKRLVLQRIRLARLQEFFEFKLLGRSAANGKWHRFGDEDPFGKNGQHAFFAIGKFVGGSDGLVNDWISPVGYV